MTSPTYWGKELRAFGGKCKYASCLPTVENTEKRAHPSKDSTPPHEHTLRRIFCFVFRPPLYHRVHVEHHAPYGGASANPSNSKLARTTRWILFTHNHPATTCPVLMFPGHRLPAAVAGVWPITILVACRCLTISAKKIVRDATL